MLRRKRRMQYRLRDVVWSPQAQRMLRARNIHYDVAERYRALDVGGIAAVHRIVRALGLMETIDLNLQLLKVRLP